MRFEQLPKLKQRAEAELSELIKDTEVTIFDWEISRDVGDRTLTIKILPKFKELTDDTKFGTIGEKGSDELPKVEFKKEYTEDTNN